ncbi:hypothetical protein [Microbacterium sp. CJ88]|uniref:hypothetical protein n=1 Tax=Microbacterium sp. CJ88 TaxID=3445672 RepID=UPI003F65F414
MSPNLEWRPGLPRRERGTADSEALSPQAETLIRFAIQNPDQFKLISDVVASRSIDKLNGRRSQEYESELLEQYRALTTHESFAPGDLVVWKPGLKNRVRPAYDEPAVVVEVLDNPVLNTESDPSSVYFREPLDILIGILDDEEEILVYHFDSRRFTVKRDDPNPS